MLQSEKVKKVLEALEDCCGKCPVCSPDCPISVARRAMEGLKYDLEQYEGKAEQD